MSGPLGLVAGSGGLPRAVAEGARARGRPVVAAALRDLAEPGLVDRVDAWEELPVGQLERLLRLFRDAGVEEQVFAGKVPKTLLAVRPERLELDARALTLLAGLEDRKDDSIAAALVQTLESEGLRVLPQMSFTPELWAPQGALGRVEPSASQLRDVAFGWPVARALGDLDVGQTVVVQDGAVLALEAIEGTDAAIRRGCGLGRPGACVVKAPKPLQDPRFDLPTIGPDTVASLVAGRAAVLAVAAGATVVLERERLAREADQAAIAVVGVAPPAVAP